MYHKGNIGIYPKQLNSTERTFQEISLTNQLIPSILASHD